MGIWHVFAALILPASSLVHCSDISFRGLDPALEVYYRPKGDSFACLDGVKTIKYENINDNYCDCFDGSDEPGSSACVNGKFYCANKGYNPQHLNASMVDDTFCDCCDGSDEQPGVCKNTCSEAGAAARAALKERAEAEAAGSKLREAYFTQASEMMTKWAAEEAQLAKSIADQKALTDKWKVKHDAVVEQERKQKEREDEAARQEAERIAKTPIDAAGQDTATAAAADGSADAAVPEEPAGDHITSMEPALTGSESAVDAADEIMKGAIKEAAEGTAQALDVPLEAVEQEADTRAMNPHEAAKQQEQQEEETAEERAKRMAAQWIRDETSDAPAENAQEAEEATEGGAAEEEAVEEAAADEDLPQTPVQSGPPSLLGRIKTAVLSILNATPFGPAEHISDGQAVKDKYWEHHNALADLERQHAEVHKKLQLDFGPNKEFLPLHGKCFEADVDKYVYEICPHGSAVQKDGAARVSLGNWEGFREGHTVMAFTGGQHCWNGPQRSMVVSISCGKVEKLKHVEEPSRCEYVAHLTTPAACSEEVARQLQQQVEEAEQAVRAHDEL